MHQDVYTPGISESATFFGMPQVVSGSWCMKSACCTKYTIFLVYVYIRS